MGKEWDGFVPPVAVWDEAMRVLKPGGHVLAFAGTRTMDLMTLGLRLAGFEIRDSVAWLYGSGFPKSMDVSKAMDKAAGAEREVVGRKGGRYAYRHNPEKASHAPNGMFRWGDRHYAWTDLPPNAREFFTKAAAEKGNITAPATDAARKWEGWGTATKPAFEPIVMARKPFRGTVAANVLEHGTGAINVDACRIGNEVRKVAPINAGAFTLDGCQSLGELRHLASLGAKTPNGRDARTTLKRAEKFNATSEPREYSGRWPANVILDEHMAGVLDEQSGFSKSPPVGSVARTKGGQTIGTFAHEGRPPSPNGHGDSGGASRFFKVVEQDAPFMYAAKAPKKERPDVDGVKHPTVKPLSIMRWLVRLVTPPDGIVLDPFAGSGTTIEAAMLEGFNVIGIEREAEYLPLIHERIRRAINTVIEAPDQGAFAFKEAR